MKMVADSTPFSANVEGSVLGMLPGVLVTEELNRLDNNDSAFEVSQRIRPGVTNIYTL